eukprot:1359835-Amphidinium_carterae.1
MCTSRAEWRLAASPLDRRFADEEIRQIQVLLSNIREGSCRKQKQATGLPYLIVIASHTFGALVNFGFWFTNGGEKGSWDE